MVSGFSLGLLSQKVRSVAAQFGCAVGLVVVLVATVLIRSGSAQVTTAIVPDSTLPTNTTVTQIDNVHNITNGTFRGANQFHSFDQFNIGDGNIASFNGPVGIQNILSRVTGGTLSSIDGTLRSTIDGANLFFMNPAGVVFGPNASLDVSGSFHVSTADFVRLGEGENTGIFSATDPATDVLTSAPPAAFGFLEGLTGSIQFKKSDLRVGNNESFLIVGGEISISGDGLMSGSAAVTAPSGVVGLVSVSSQGEVPISPGEVDLAAFANLGDISLTDFALLDTSGDSSGTVVIRGGQLILDESHVLTGTHGSIDGADIGVDIEVMGDVFLTRGSSIASDVLSSGKGGDIQIHANSLKMTDAAVLESRGFDGSSGDLGNIEIKARDLIDTKDSRISLSFFAESLSTGGDINLTATELVIDNTSIVNDHFLGSPIPIGLPGSGNFVLSPGGTGVGEVNLEATKIQLANDTMIGGSSLNGDSGKVSIIGVELLIDDTEIDSSAFDDDHSAGGVMINGTNITINRSRIRNDIESDGDSGGVNIFGSQVTVNDTSIRNFVDGAGEDPGRLIISAEDLVITQSTIMTNGQFFGKPGELTITATNQINLDSSSIVAFTGNGDLGKVTVSAKGISLLNSSVESENRGIGNGGEILISADAVLLDGSMLSTNSFSAAAGSAGAVIIRGFESEGSAASTLSLTNGGEITSVNNGAGSGGSILIHAEKVLLDGKGSNISASTFGDFPLSLADLTVDLNITHTDPRNLAVDLISPSGTEITLFDRVRIGNGESLTDLRFDDLAERSISLPNPPASGTFRPVEQLGQLIDEPANGFWFLRIFDRRDSFPAGIFPDEGELQAWSLALGNNSFQSTDVPKVTVDDSSIFSRLLVDAGQDAVVKGETLVLNDGGNVEINAQSVEVLNGATISGSTTGSGTGGTVTVRGEEALTVSGPGSGIFTNATGTGFGGNINVQAPQMSISDESVISASTSGEGNAGTITLTGESLTLASQARIENSTSGDGSGGTITINADQVLLDGVGTSISANTSFSVDSSADLAVVLDILHTFDGDLEATLVSPSGTPVMLFSGAGGAGENFTGTRLDDRGNISINEGEAPFTGVFRPTTPLAQVIGESLSGTWTLQVSDQAGGDEGALSTFSLAFGDQVVSSQDVPQSIIDFETTSATLQVDAGIDAIVQPVGPDAGSIFIDGQAVQVINGATISGNTTGSGTGGTVTVRGEEALTVSGPGSGIFTNATGTGFGGNINVQAPQMSISDESVISASTSGEGNAGTITLTGESLTLASQARIESSTSGDGSGGTITINADQVLLDGVGTSISANTSFSVDSSADLAVVLDILHTFDGDLEATLVSPSGTPVMLFSGAGGAGENFTGTRLDDRGNISINEGEAPFTGVFRPTTPLAQVIGESLSGTWTLQVSDQAGGDEGALSTFSLAFGDQVVSSQDVPQSIIDFETTSATLQVDAGIDARVQPTQSDNVGGTISIDGQSVQITNGATVTGNTTGSGKGGTVTVRGEDTLTISGFGSGIFTTTSGVGGGGDLTLQGQSITLSDSALVSAESAGAGNAGTITVGDERTQTVRLENGFIEATALSASGGDIKVEAQQLIQIVDSRIESAVQGDATTQGGNISIDPDAVVIQNSQILANATSEGAGGNIEIVGNVVLVDPQSVIDASSNLGVSGTVNIQAPIQNLSGTIAPLPDVIIEAATLYGARCSAQKGSEFSSFNVRGRDRIPREPGDYLWTPLWSRGVPSLTSERPGITSSPMAQRLGLSGMSSTSGSAFAFLDHGHHVWELFDEGCRS